MSWTISLQILLFSRFDKRVSKSVTLFQIALPSLMAKAYLDLSLPISTTLVRLAPVMRPKVPPEKARRSTQVKLAEVTNLDTEEQRGFSSLKFRGL